ncbi:hypothetical protein HOLleu_09715 [Holothuria leucospilota]|uniref:Uncharacterized protein n=1 Tax=Holothuria leucospilota TaxID=206669 RepID=A0A9Q1CDU9_HOLLE|nr:hypothetical protein HOLleu_09715 [Holothuria leucospilota]
MPKKVARHKSERSGQESLSSLSENSVCDNTGLHRLEKESQKLLKRVTDKQRAKWKPLSASTMQLVFSLIEKHKESTFEGMEKSDVKALQRHFLQFRERLEEACKDISAPACTMDYKILNADYAKLVETLEETNNNLKEVDKNITKYRRLIKERKREVDDLEKEVA